MSEKQVRWKLTAMERISSVLDRVNNRFGKLRKTTIRASAGFDQFQKRTERFRKTMSRTGKAMQGIGAKMAIGLTAPVALFARSALNSGRDFQLAMNEVEAKTKITSVSLEQLRSKAKELGRTTQFAATEAGQGMAFLSKAGFESKEIFDSIGPSLHLAAAGNINLADAANIVSNIMGGFKLKKNLRDTTLAADALAITTASSNVNMTQMGEAMKEAAPLAEKFGATIGETSAMTGMLGNIGIQGTRAGTGLKRMFLGLAAPTSQARKSLDALGVSVVNNEGKFRNIGSIMKDLSVQIQTLPESERLDVLDSMFGKIGITSAAELLNPKTIKEYEKLNKMITDNQVAVDGGKESAVAQMATTMRKGLPAAMDRVRSTWEGLQIAFTEGPVGDFFTDLLNKVADFFKWVSELSPATLKWIAVLAGVAAAVGPLLLALGSIMVMMPALISGWGAFSAIAGSLSLTGGGLLLIFAKIAAILGGLIFIGVKVKDVLVEVFESPEHALESFFKTLVSFLPFGDKIIAAWEPLKKWLFGLFDTVASKLNKLMNKVKSIAAPIGKALGISSNPTSETSNQTFDRLGKENSGLANKVFFGNSKNGGPSVQKTENIVTVDFKNIPKGTIVKGADSDNPALNVNLGLQGASNL